MSDLPDFLPGGVDLILRPEWAAKEGTDQNFFAEDVDIAVGGSVEFTYAIPSGKKLYITDYEFFSGTSEDASRDLNQMVHGGFRVGFDFKSEMGGNGGGGKTFSKPYVIEGGTTLRGFATNWANHICTIGIIMHGYLE